MESFNNSSGPIIGDQYCLPHPADLAFTVKIAGVSHGELAITDVSGSPLFWFDGSFDENRWFLVDANSSHILVSMRKKSWTTHGRWQVFRGDSMDEKDLLFSVKRSSVFQIHTKLEVFLAGNAKEDECDFMIKGKYHKRSIHIYKGDSDTSTVLAQMSKEHKVVRVPLEKHAFGVRINPNIDFAFIASLMSIAHHLNEVQVDHGHQMAQMHHHHQMAQMHHHHQMAQMHHTMHI